MPESPTIVHYVQAIILIIFFFVFQPLSASTEVSSHVLLRMRQTMRSCKYEFDCAENAYCFNRETCLCMDGFLVNRNRTQCLRIATTLGDSCNEDVQCRVTFTAQAECRNNVCVCSVGSHYEAEAKRCYESVGIGKMCQTSYNCYIEDSKSFCVDGFCSCPLQHHPKIDGTSCLRSAFLGQKCAIDDECLALHSRCYGTCGCKVDYVLSKDKKRCLKAANLIGDSCEEDSQCKAFLKNAKCGDENKCTCVMEFNRRGSVCLRKINPDMIEKSCYSRSQCVLPVPEEDLMDIEVANVDCFNGICACAQDYTLTEDKTDCIRYSENGGERIIKIWLLPYIIIPKLIHIVYS